MRLRCWCCGQELGESFALVTSVESPRAVDTVYLALPQHAGQQQDGQQLRVMRMVTTAGSGGRKGKRIVPKS